MGWASGTELAIDLINTIQNEIKDNNTRYRIYLDTIKALEDSDWDCQSEATGIDPAFDSALKELHPDWDWD